MRGSPPGRCKQINMVPAMKRAQRLENVSKMINLTLNLQHDYGNNCALQQIHDREIASILVANSTSIEIRSQAETKFWNIETTAVVYD